MDCITDPGLALYLPLHEMDGISLMSRDALGHQAIDSGTVWAPQGRSFAGNDSIDCGKSPILNSQKYTLSCWFRTTASSPDTDIGHRLINIARAVGGESKIALMLKNNLTDLFWITKDTFINSVSSGITVNNDQWYHLAGTTDGTTFIIYLNGEFKAAKISSLHTDFYGLSIGAVHTGVGAYNGMIGEIMVYNRVLTAVEIQRNYLSTKLRYR